MAFPFARATDETHAQSTRPAPSLTGKLLHSIRHALKRWSSSDDRQTHRLLFEPLEPRLLLSGDPLVYQAAAGVALDASIRLAPGDSSIVQIYDNTGPGSVLAQQAVADTSEVVVTGANQNDQFGIDASLTASDLLLTFNGAEGDDTL
ncbi:MAG: LEPR-XLL domain-containing protein, partial [Pseudohongiellaceae bacterium]